MHGVLGALGEGQHMLGVLGALGHMLGVLGALGEAQHNFAQLGVGADWLVVEHIVNARQALGLRIEG